MATRRTGKRSVHDHKRTGTIGGKEIAPITLEKGEELTLPTAEKDGRVFADWYYEESFTSVCLKKIIAEKYETLYARYGAILT